VVAVQEAQLALNPVCAYAVAPVEVPAPVTQEAQAKFVASQAYPVAQPLQVKTLETSTVHAPQLAVIPVYVSAVPPTEVPVPALHEAQALFVKSQVYPVAQAEQTKAVTPVCNILEGPLAAKAHVPQLVTIPVYVPADAAVLPVLHETQSMLVVSRAYPAKQVSQVKTLLEVAEQVAHVGRYAVYVNPPEFTPVAQLTQALLSPSHEYPSMVEHPVQVRALEASTVHVSHPAKFPVYPVVASEQETQTLFVES
jgi:hypothetical protein